MSQLAASLVGFQQMHEARQALYLSEQKHCLRKAGT